jgi:hypothetical protein
MKKNIIYTMLLLGLTVMLTLCTDMNDVSKEFLSPETRYAGSPDTIKVLPGNGRVVLNFRLMDKAVNRIYIYWNNRKDSLNLDEDDFVMDVSPKEFNVEIAGLTREGSYSFEIVTCDIGGNKSIVSRATGKAYGATYLNSLLDTPLTVNENGDILEITWGSPDANADRMEIFYTNTEGKEVTQEYIVPDVLSTFVREYVIKDRMQGTDVKYRTVYRPEVFAVDLFYTPYQRVKLAQDYDRINWLIDAKWDPTNSPNGENGNGPRTPQLALDGNVDTHWHMEKIISNTQPATLEFPEILDIDGFYMQQRNGAEGKVGATPFKTVWVLTSENKTTWTRIDIYTFQKVQGKQRFDFKSRLRTRYLRITIVDDWDNPTAATSKGTGIAELGVYYYPDY